MIIIKTYEQFTNKNTIKVYHGGDSKITNENIKLPIFTTSDKNGAEWYTNRGIPSKSDWMTTMEVSLNNPLNLSEPGHFEKKWIPIIKDAKIDYDMVDDGYGEIFHCDEISEYSDYDGSNPLDLVYIPRFVEEAKKRGYDVIFAFDVLFQDEIPVYIPFYKNNINVLSSTQTQ
jgi:hypothetical protein